MRSLAVAVSCVFAASALADAKVDAIARALDWTFDSGDHDKPNPPLVLLNDDQTQTTFDNIPPFPQPGLSPQPRHPVTVVAADGVGWIAADLAEVFACGMEGCDKILRDYNRKAEREPPFHMTALVDNGKPIFIHVGKTGAGVGHGAAMTAQIDDAAKPAVDLFEKTIGDPKAFAATVSERKDAMMYGTAPNERFVGGAAMRASLAKWGLSFNTVGGIRAGTTKSKAIAWVIADVDARKKSAKPSPYRVSVVYEKAGVEWKIVQLHFS